MLASFNSNLPAK